MSIKTLEHAKVTTIEEVVGQHELEFYALAFSTEPDSQGDRIDPHALDGWLERFYAEGKALPVSYHHAAMRGESAGDPFSVIGYAPADPAHVYVDGYGLRIRAILETEINENAEQVYRLARNGVLHGASAVFMSVVESERKMDDGSTMITEIPLVKEVGPTLSPANTDAYLVSVKAEREVEKWDGAAAMRRCSSAADFRQVAFELRNDSDPDTAAHWALPHHNAPGGPPDQGGVSAALGRLNQTGATVMSKDAIRSHLEAHQPAKAQDYGPEPLDIRTLQLVSEAAEVTRLAMFAKAGRTYSRANEKLIRQAMDLLTQALVSVSEVPVDEAKVNDDEPDREKSDEPNAWVHEALAAFPAATTPE